MVDRGGGRRGLRQKDYQASSPSKSSSPGQEPLLAGNQRHPDLVQLLSERRLNGWSRCAVVVVAGLGAPCLLCSHGERAVS